MSWKTSDTTDIRVRKVASTGFRTDLTGGWTSYDHHGAELHAGLPALVEIRTTCRPRNPHSASAVGLHPLPPSGLKRRSVFGVPVAAAALIGGPGACRLHGNMSQSNEVHHEHPVGCPGDHRPGYGSRPRKSRVRPSIDALHCSRPGR